MTSVAPSRFKEGASFCYYAYVLGISGLVQDIWVTKLIQWMGIFVWFMSMWKKQILARGIRIQYENGGTNAFFRDN